MVVVGQGRCSIKLEAEELLPMSRLRLGHRVVKEKRSIPQLAANQSKRGTLAP